MQLIDRTKLIAEMDVMIRTGFCKPGDLLRLATQQPVVDQNINWIKCKDRQPDREGKYLTTIFAGEFTIIRTATWIPRSQKWIPDVEGYLNNVVAWMELPEAYGKAK